MFEDTESFFSKMVAWHGWPAVLWITGGLALLGLLFLAAIGLMSLGVISLDNLLPREHDRIAGASIVATAVGTLLLFVATVLLFVATQRLARYTLLSIATDSPLLAFELTIDDTPTATLGRGPAPDHPEIRFFPQEQDANYLQDFIDEDIGEKLWALGQPIQYVRLNIENVQTRRYAAAREIIFDLILTFNGHEARTNTILSRRIVLPVLPAEGAFGTPVFNVGGIGSFEAQITLLEYRELHSDVKRRGGYGTGYLDRSVEGKIERIDVVSRPTKREVPA